MQTCEIPFLIWFTGRTGSTFLCDLLDSHPQVACRKEQFCEVKITEETEFPVTAQVYSNNAGKFGRRLFRDNDIVDDPTSEQVLDYLQGILNDDARACGFKLKFPNQTQCYPDVVNQLRTIGQLKVVELVRENVLKQAISLRNVTRIQQMGVAKASNAIQQVDLVPLELDIELAIKHASYFLRSRTEFHEFSNQFAHVLSIKYEQLLADGPGFLRQILEFLDVDPNVELQSRFQKTTPDRIADAVANYDELVAAVTGTELEKFLD